MSTSLIGPRQRPLPEAALVALFQRAPWRLVPASQAEHGPLLQQWIDADPPHAGQRAEDWLRPVHGREVHMAVDAHGPVLCLRMSRALRIDMEFAPGAERRIAAVLPTGLIYVAGVARESGAHEMLTESRSPRLVRLLHRLGWRPSQAEHVYAL